MCLRREAFVLQLVLLAPIDNLYVDTHYITRHVYVYADDLTIVIIAPLADIVSHACHVLRMLVSALRSVDLQPARHKMTVTGFDMSVARRVCRIVGSLGYRAVTALEVLGIEVAGGRALRFKRLGKRVQATRRRLPRLKMIKCIGPLIGRFVQAALPSAMTYGLPVHGAPPALVAAMRVTMRSAWYEPGAAGSAFLSTFIHGGQSQDPQIAAWCEPIHQWAMLA